MPVNRQLPPTPDPCTSLFLTLDPCTSLFLTPDPFTSLSVLPLQSIDITDNEGNLPLSLAPIALATEIMAGIK